jgi:DNA-binding MarR family transcriptional regulator
MSAKKILASIPHAIHTIRRLSAGSLLSDLTFQQYRFLQMIHNGSGQTQIAQNLQVSMAAVSKAVNVLVKKNLLVRETGDDRRCLKLKLTNEGNDLRKIVRGQVENQINSQFKKLTKQEQSDLIKGLDVLDKLMGYVNEK